MAETLLSTGQVAKLYNVSTETIRRWVKLGIIEYELVGNQRLRRRQIRIRQSEAEKHFGPVEKTA